MIDAAERVRDLIGELSVDALRMDTLRREAVLWNITVLGEAAVQISPEVKDRHPEVGWAPPSRMCNRIVHGYWDVDLQILHEAAAHDFPPLIERLAAVLAELERTEEGR
jgi:uncharacterized protein with HEPN domain